MLTTALSTLLADSSSDLTQVKHDAHYRLVFLLANSVPSQVKTWAIEAALDRYLKAPLALLAPAANLTIVSKVAFYPTLDVNPTRDSLGRHVVRVDQLPYFLDRSSWDVDLEATSIPTLYFALYLPPPEHAPLHIVSSKGDSLLTNSFLIPQWGGIVVLNLPTPLEGGHLTTDHLNRPATIWLAQLRQFFGLTSTPSALVSELQQREDLKQLLLQADPASNGIAVWESDLVLLRHLARSQVGAAETLLRFASLMEKLPNIPVEDYIGELLRESLSALEEVCPSLPPSAHLPSPSPFLLRVVFLRPSNTPTQHSS